MEKELDKSLADLHQDRYLMHKVEPQIFGTQVRSEFVRFLGDDNIIPYDKEDIQQHLGKYDLVIDTHGNLTHKDFVRMGQRGVLPGFTTMGNMMSVLLKNMFSKFPITQFTAKAIGYIEAMHTKGKVVMV